MGTYRMTIDFDTDISVGDIIDEVEAAFDIAQIKHVAQWQIKSCEPMVQATPSE